MLVSGCMLTDQGIRVYHRTERANFTMVDDDVFLYGEHSYDEECIDNCTDGSTRNHAYRLYSMKASTGRRILLASDSGNPRPSLFIKPFLYLPSTSSDSIIRVQPETDARVTVANRAGLFRHIHSQSYLSSSGKYAVLRECPGNACVTSLYDAADQSRFNTTSIVEYSMYLEDDSLVLYGMDGVPDTDRVKVYAYHVLTGVKVAGTREGKYASGINLDDGSQILLYRNASGVHMFPEIANAKLKEHLPALAEMEWYQGLSLNPVSGAYFQIEGSHLYSGNLYTGKRKQLHPIRSSDR